MLALCCRDWRSQLAEPVIARLETGRQTTYLSAMSAILVLNGPNLRGGREPGISAFNALRALDEPLIEVHLSNIYRRETFRQHSHVSLAANGMLCGFGPRGYLMTLHAIAAMLADATSD